MPLSIEVGERELCNVIRKICRWVFVFGIVLCINVIGFQVTPRDTNGRLLILTPGIAEIVRYQKHITDWAREMLDSEGKMKALLDNKTDDIYIQDINFQNINQTVNKIATEVDQTSVPDSFTELRDLMVKAARAHQHAASAVGQWLGDPSSDTYNNALTMINLANNILGQVESNQWILVR